MHAAAYRRARKLLSAPARLILARTLGACLSLLIFALLGILCLFMSLMANQGQLRFPAGRLASLPNWIVSRSLVQEPPSEVDLADQEVRLFENTGIYPVVAGNLLSANPIHKGVARSLDRLIAALPALRTNRGALATLSFAGLLLLLLLSIVAKWRRAILASAATDVASNLRRQIHRQMYRLGQSSLPSEGIGPIVNLWTREVNDVRDAVFADLAVVPKVHILMIGMALAAFALSPVLTFFLASLGALVWMTSRILSRESRRNLERALRDAAIKLCLLHEDLGLLRTVRVFGMETFDKERFDTHLAEYDDADARRLVYEGHLNTTTVLLYGAALIVALAMIGFNVIISERISFASMIILIAALAGLAIPLFEILRLRRLIRRADRSARGIFEFLERQPELLQQVGAKFLPPLEHEITFEGVVLEGRSGRPLLNGVSIEIEAGTRTAIMGLDDDARFAVGCLIPRLIDPKSGRVAFDGKDLREMTLESIRAQVGTVLQADMVFSDSVLVNIGLGEPNNSLPRIIEAAKLAHAHHFIQDLPNGYDTIIGATGHYLQPHEQFRIALARACLHDPSILIIDELAGPLDEDICHLLDDSLARLAVGRTLIILPRRLSTIRNCDQVILLHEGKVAEAGPPAQLHAESKLFRHIEYVEFNEFASGAVEAGKISV